MNKIILLILIIIFIIIINKSNLNDIIEEKYTAIIVEPREHKALSFVLLNFLENLSDDWGIVICHGTKNIDYVNNIINKELVQYKNRITLVNLQVSNLTINDYNSLLTSEKFHEYIPTETFIVFQTDSMICPEYKNLINEFLEYDYVGAPWCNIYKVKEKVGNGGLSLRKKSKMLEIIKKCPKKEIDNEDIYFSHSCIDINKPSIDKASDFSIETTYKDKSWGVHKFWKYNDSKNIESKKNYCKGIDTLISLQ